jgi:hypothetical protein
VRWGEGNLFNFGKVVLNILVEGELSDLSQWDLLLWPDLGQVEDVPAELLSFFWRENLDVDGPAWEVTFLDRVEQILGVPVWVLGCHLASLFIGESLATLVGLKMDLDIVEASIRLVPLVGVSGVSVHVSIRVWSTTVAEEVHDLVNSFLVGGEVVPEHSSILQVGLGISLLGMDEERELGWVSEEEDGSVVVDPIPVTLLSVELDGETSWISCGIRGAFLTTDS